MIMTDQIIENRCSANENRNNSLYDIFHSFRVEKSCLSFDLISKKGQNLLDNFIYAVSGSQIRRDYTNTITLMKCDNIKNIEDNVMNPQIKYITLCHNGGVNRIRSKHIDNHLFCASWSEHGKVNIYNLDKEFNALNDDVLFMEIINSSEIKAPLVINNHKIEGFAMNWGKDGSLLTGDNNGEIFLTVPKESHFETHQNSFLSHKSSVEDLEWKYNDENIFMSCSSDKSIILWDKRSPKPSNTIQNAHPNDVNVISWNNIENNSVLSGGDDGLIKLWDLRQQEFVRNFKYHMNNPITSIEWCYNSSSIFAASSEDNKVTQWDITLPLDDGDNYESGLCFIHCGQKQIKEIHWSSDISGLLMTTAIDGFNLFKTKAV